MISAVELWACPLYKVVGRRILRMRALSATIAAKQRTAAWILGVTSGVQHAVATREDGDKQKEVQIVTTGG